MNKKANLRDGVYNVTTDAYTYTHAQTKIHSNTLTHTVSDIYMTLSRTFTKKYMFRIQTNSKILRFVCSQYCKSVGNVEIYPIDSISM